MKKIILILLVTVGILRVHAQTLEQANTYLYYERTKSAETIFHQLLKQDPNNGEAWFGLVKTYALEDSIKKANDTVLLAPVSVQSNPYFMVAKGYTLLQQNRKDEAAKYFEQALNDTRSKDAGILSAIADAHIDAKEGDANFAIDLLQKAIKKDKKNAALYVKLGDAYRRLNNGSEAFIAYQQAIEKNDKYALAYHRMGKIFITQNNPEIYVKYFKNAIEADPNFSPSLYLLYAYEFNREPAKAMAYYNDYLKNSDTNVTTEYELADLLYTNKQYKEAVAKANHLLQSGAHDIKPRLYKLMAYSYAAIKDTSKALVSMESYFNKEKDTNLIAKDYFVMADYYAAIPGNDSLAIVYLEKGSGLEKDSTTLYAYYKKLADLAKVSKDYAAQAKWLAKYYPGNNKATNLDLFNWGLAHYLSGNYVQSDSVFKLYTDKYPQQSFGYYWQAKSKAQQDTTMQLGLALPAYQKLIEVLAADTADVNYKKSMVEAYQYMAAYEVNVQKNYSVAVQYFKNILEVDPENKTAEKYIQLLDKYVENKNSKTSNL